jgi:tRNA/tmRNA/rRNA uracil-C5-methylase (TrmA/RlmC/RlmD family)
MAEQTTNFAEPFELTIDTIVTGGDGLGRLDGRVVFVPGTAPGEKVRAKAELVKKGFVKAELIEVLEPSADRVDPPLGEAGTVGGCDLQHLSIEAQRRVKHNIVLDCFKRQGGLDMGEKLQEAVTESDGLGYRNKVRLHRDPIGMWGVIKQGTHDILPIEHHGLMPTFFNETILPWVRLLPPVDQVVVRMDADGGWLVSLFGQPSRLRTVKGVLDKIEGDPAPGCRGILFNNRPLWGRDHLLMRINERTWRCHALSFFQVNLDETSGALDLVSTWLDEAGQTTETKGGALIDLYGGVGLFGLAFGDRFNRVIGVEENRQAVLDARNNYQRDQDLNSKAIVYCAPVDKVTKAWKFATEGSGQPPRGKPDDPIHAELVKAAAQGKEIDWSKTTVIVDPPRTGLGEHVTNDLSALQPARIYYLSCDPATLARDCGALVKSGYEVARGRVIDMFPMTSHVETLVELVRS